MAATCNFGDNLNCALGDQFVAGADTRRKLLGKDNSFDDVVKIALADEVAATEVSHVGASSVNYVKPGTSSHFAGKSSKSHSFVKKGKSANVNMHCEMQKSNYAIANDKLVNISSAYVC